VLYRMLTGRTYLDFDQRETPVAQAANVERIHRQAPRPPSAHNHRVPAWLDTVVLRSLSKDPQARYATARELGDALAGPQPGAQAGVSRAIPARVWAIAAATAAVALILVGALAVALGARPGPGAVEAPTAPPAVAVVIATTTLAPTPPPVAVALAGRILFASPTEDAVEIGLIDLPTGEVTTLSRFTGHESWTSDLSLDGRRFACTATYPDGVSDLFLLDIEVGWQAAILHDFEAIASLSLSPDGERIAFSAGSGDGREVYVVQADGSGLVNLTNQPGADTQPAWSPAGGHGERIAFVSRRDGGGDLYLMAAGGGGVTRLTRTGKAPYGGPTWAPGGEQIAFLGGGEYPNYDMYLVGADGNGLVRLVDWPEADGSPSYPEWSPDGTATRTSTPFAPMARPWPA